MFEENEFHDAIRKINEEPFITLTARLENLQTSNETWGHHIYAELDQITKEAAIATVTYHTRIARRYLGEKGMKILATAPREYLAWKNSMRRRDPILDIQKCGIVELEHQLSSLPAQTNISSYCRHFFETLPQLVQKACHINAKHDEDQRYADMRQESKRQMPFVKADLQSILSDLLNEYVASPWSSREKANITKSFTKLIDSDWRRSIVWAGWAKMLRENGIPMNGKYHGRNLNDELLQIMLPYIQDWNSTMSSRVDLFTQSLQRPAQGLLRLISQHIDESSAAPGLKSQAHEVLEGTVMNIEAARTRLLEELRTALKQVYIRYTTEDDVLCPVAKEMQRRYQRANESLFAEPGPGIYGRQRMVLEEEILHPWREYCWEGTNEILDPLVDNIQNQIVSQLYGHWEHSCRNFIEDVDAELQEFSRSLDNLLMPDAYLTDEHKKVRELLGHLVEDFNASLMQIQHQLRAAAITNT